MELEKLKFFMYCKNRVPPLKLLVEIDPWDTFYLFFEKLQDVISMSDTLLSHRAPPDVKAWLLIIEQF